ncbi:hypothetical protein C2E23DRAFT_695215, partial [Lenzites betulinus]
LPRDFKVVAEGQPVRILGAWIGNGVNQVAIWKPTVEKIRKNLERWGRRKPTMYGRKLIVGMEIGGRTQYLARVQSMPAGVEAELKKMIADFVWEGAGRPLVRADTLCQTVEEGGL